MGFDFDWAEDGTRFECRFNGDLDAASIRACAGELASSRAISLRAVYIDLSRVENFEVGFEQLAPHAEVIKALMSGAAHRWIEVICAPSDVGFGLGRMYQSLIDGALDIRVHRDEVAARADWQRVLDQLSSELNSEARPSSPLDLNN